jgi:hypothetical protein
MSADSDSEAGSTSGTQRRLPVCVAAASSSLPPSSSLCRWEGGTLILPGWLKLKAVYHDEFDGVPSVQRPRMLAVVISDGEAEDNDAFIRAMRSLDPDFYVVVGVIGYGEAYEAAIAAYRAVAAVQPRLRVVALSGHNALDISRQLMDMMRLH